MPADAFVANGKCAANACVIKGAKLAHSSQGEEDDGRDRPKPTPPTKEEIYKANSSVRAGYAWSSHSLLGPTAV